MALGAGYRPDPRLPDELPQSLYVRVWPAAFPQTIPRLADHHALADVGLAALDTEAWCQHFGRFVPLPNNLQQPLALAYHGHQFRVYNPDIGDGRGFLFAQLRETGTDRLLDLGTKGSGTTPFSRGGDGRLTLKGAVREHLAACQLDALGVPTARTAAILETGEALYRDDEPSPTRAAVLTRLSWGHIRVGTFQRTAYQRDTAGRDALLAYCCKHFVADTIPDEPGAQALAVLDHAVARNAELGAHWLMAGFVHGVLNTDNININGESFDYGPWRFLPTYDRSYTAAYFDEMGLYAFGRQPSGIKWALARLAECFLDIADRDSLAAILERFDERFHAGANRVLCARLNLVPRGYTADQRLLQALLDFLETSQAGFEQTLYDLYGGPARADQRAASPQAHLYDGEAFQNLARELAAYGCAEPRRLAHPYFRRGQPVTLLGDEVEALWTAIAERDDWAPLHAKLAAIGEMKAAQHPSSVL